MDYYQDIDWIEENKNEDFFSIDYLFEEDAEASDQLLWDTDTRARIENEWEPSEEDDDQAVDAAVDPVLKYIGDVSENANDPIAPISTATLIEQLDEVSVERRTQVAYSEAEYNALIKEMDRLDRNRERRERYREILKEEFIPEGNGEIYSGRLFPVTLDSPESKMILRGIFLDIFYNCPYEMHQLTADPFISHIIQELSDLQKETLYLLSLQLFSTSRLACMRGQSDRNIRKIRDNYTKKLQQQLYGHLCAKRRENCSLSAREKEFLYAYEMALKERTTEKVKVKRENQYPKRMRTTDANGNIGNAVGVAV